jgi:hypothetical protein
MSAGTFNLLFFADESKLHLYHMVESGNVYFAGDRLPESGCLVTIAQNEQY